LVSNEQAASAAIAQAREAKRKKLCEALLGLLAPHSMSSLREVIGSGDVSTIHEVVCDWAVACYDAGYDDGFAEAGAEYAAAEDNRNEGYE
jgi:hypothetical protein